MVTGNKKAAGRYNKKDYSELMHWDRAVGKHDLNERRTWFSNVMGELNGEDMGKFIKQLR